jgi:bifunctional DNA-binding transcriptional regulator/antitoxin component of YhaV-PrlF toxin-antitoxin module
MKLQKQKARIYKGKIIYKYLIVVPPKDVKELGWKVGTELDGTIIKDKGYFLTVKD